MSTPDPAVSLEEIRADLAHLKACASAVPGKASVFDLEVLMPRYARAVAAVEAALGHHVEAVIEDMPEPRFRYCKTCSSHPAWPCPEVADITTALTSTQSPVETVETPPTRQEAPDGR